MKRLPCLLCGAVKVGWWCIWWSAPPIPRAKGCEAASAYFCDPCAGRLAGRARVMPTPRLHAITKSAERQRSLQSVP